jgi:hypothetical protein
MTGLMSASRRLLLEVRRELRQADDHGTFSIRASRLDKAQSIDENVS